MVSAHASSAPAVSTRWQESIHVSDILPFFWVAIVAMCGGLMEKHQIAFTCLLPVRRVQCMLCTLQYDHDTKVAS